MGKNELSGHDYMLKWDDFLAAVPPNRPADMDGFTAAAYDVRYEAHTFYESIGIKTKDEPGWRLTNVKIKVSPSRARMWSVKAARRDELLVHEQGHYDIVAFTMSDLWTDLLSPPDLFKTAQDARVWGDSMLAEAGSLIRKLNATPTDPGLYDTMTKHSRAKVEQARWNDAFQICRNLGMRFRDALDAEGISIP